MKRKFGFTLIELVIVIVILGILAVVAVPRFLQIQSDARKADLQQLAGTLKSTVATVNAKAMIEGTDTGGDISHPLIVNGIQIANGYPLSSKSGIVKTLQSPDRWYIKDNITVNSISTGVTLFSLNPLDNSTKTNLLSGCYVMYAYLPKDESAAEDGSSGGWWRWLSQQIKSALTNGICLVLHPIGYAKNLPFCPQFEKPKDYSGTINIPTILVVDDKC
ncbi:MULTISPECIES: prepilin-type N-terminal cleavage/methylation domain-containing protein [unclassified Photobacterium]|uniref:type II secretion system protein n=1 Tax=unclassified Photobacterium TaxID=2628852 RepID=UPI0023E01EC2|nr:MULTISPECIES: prepilin-type N-terminal cleavage/methylation domain-containing protein [unclassified Photobacterium]MCG3866285.1 prepilin-type N-terminal cleavage/methylation domain-containing protein [Photobacterium sp. Ph6]MCG3877813.1 prepilin-type N-terminal cleavage/methylation domain-containing protein [Photobacterium sp. Ph5]